MRVNEERVPVQGVARPASRGRQGRRATPQRWWPALLALALLPIPALGATAAHASEWSASIPLNDTDAGITYSGSWRHFVEPNMGDYQGDVHATTSNGDSFSYRFRGTGITYVDRTSANQGTADVLVDGVKQSTVDLTTSIAAQHVVYSVSGLSSDWHTLTVVKDSGQWMFVDSLIVQLAGPPPGSGGIDFGTLSTNASGEVVATTGQLLPHAASLLIAPAPMNTYAFTGDPSFTATSLTSACATGSGGCVLVTFSPTADGPRTGQFVLSGSSPTTIPLQGAGTHFEVTLRGCSIWSYGTACPHGDFSRQDLSNLILTGAALDQANFDAATLDHADLAGSTLTNTDLQDASAQYTDLSGSNLTSAHLEKANLQYANLSGSNLSGVNLQGANLEHADLRGANLSGAYLDHADLQYAKLAGATVPSNLPDTIEWTTIVLPLITPPSGPVPAQYNDVPYSPVQVCELRPVGADCDGMVIDVNMSGFMLQKASFRYALFGPSSGLAGADLTGADLSRAVFAQGYNLQGATVANATFEDTNMDSANLQGANLSGAHFKWSAYSKANYAISLAETIGSLITQASGGVSLATKVKPLFNLLTHGEIDVVKHMLNANPQATLTIPQADANVLACGTPDQHYADASAACNVTPQMWSMNFTGANLTKVNFDAVSMACDNFTSANLVGATMSGSGDYFSGSLFTGANLSGVDMDHAFFDMGPGMGDVTSCPGQSTTFTNATLAGVDLSWAQLDSATLGGASLTSANLQNANLTSVSLENVNLTNANISHAAVGGSRWYTSTNVTGLQWPINATVSKIDSISIPNTQAGQSGCILFNQNILEHTHTTGCGVAA